MRILRAAEAEKEKIETATKAAKVARVAAFEDAAAAAAKGNGATKQPASEPEMQEGGSNDTGIRSIYRLSCVSLNTSDHRHCRK